MAINVTYKPQWQASIDIEEGLSSSVEAIITFDDPATSLSSILSNLPSIGSYLNFWFATNIWSRLRSISVNRTGLNSATATLFYEPDVGNKNDNPTQDPPQYSLSHEELTVYPECDFNGKPFVNSAGDRLMPGLPVKLPIQVITIEKNYSSFPLYLSRQFYGAVNSQRFWGYAPGYVLCAGLTARSQDVRNGIMFFRTSITLKISPIKWNPTQVLDRGTRWKDDDGKLRHILIEGSPVKEPVNLDGNGKPLSPGSSPVFLSFNNYREADLNGLGV